MATAKAKVNSEPIAVEEPEIDLDKYEHIIVKGMSSKPGHIRCKLPKEPGIDDMLFGLNGEFKQIMLGEWVDLPVKWADFVEERLANREALNKNNSKILEKFSN